MTTTAIKLSPKVQKLVLTKEGNIHRHYYYALQNCRIVGNRIYPKTWQARKHLRDYSSYIENILKASNYKIRKDNTAPRGGVEGDCYILSKQALQVIENVKNYYSQF